MKIKIYKIKNKNAGHFYSPSKGGSTKGKKYIGDANLQRAMKYLNKLGTRLKARDENYVFPIWESVEIGEINE